LFVPDDRSEALYELCAAVPVADFVQELLNDIRILHRFLKSEGVEGVDELWFREPEGEQEEILPVSSGYFVHEVDLGVEGAHVVDDVDLIAYDRGVQEFVPLFSRRRADNLQDGVLRDIHVFVHR